VQRLFLELEPIPISHRSAGMAGPIFGKSVNFEKQLFRGPFNGSRFPSNKWINRQLAHWMQPNGSPSWLLSGSQLSVKKIFIKLFDVDHLFNTAADIKTNHQTGQKLPVNQYDPLAKHICRLFCCL